MMTRLAIPTVLILGAAIVLASLANTEAAESNVHVETASTEPVRTASRTPQPQARAEQTAPVAVGAAQPLPTGPAKANKQQALVAQLRASGAAVGAWQDRARALLPTGDFECHRAGCVATTTYADELAFEMADDQLTKSDAFLAYPGWRHRSIGKDANGRIVATWFFMAE